MRMGRASMTGEGERGRRLVVAVERIVEECNLPRDVVANEASASLVGDVAGTRQIRLKEDKTLLLLRRGYAELEVGSIAQNRPSRSHCQGTVSRHEKSFARQCTSALEIEGVQVDLSSQYWTAVETEAPGRG